MSEKYDSFTYRFFGDSMKDYGTMFPWWKKNEILRPVSFAMGVFICVILGLYILVV